MIFQYFNMLFIISFMMIIVGRSEISADRPAIFIVLAYITIVPLQKDNFVWISYDYYFLQDI